MGHATAVPALRLPGFIVGAATFRYSERSLSAPQGKIPLDATFNTTRDAIGPLLRCQRYVEYQ